MRGTIITGRREPDGAVLFSTTHGPRTAKLSEEVYPGAMGEDGTRGADVPITSFVLYEQGEPLYVGVEEREKVPRWHCQREALRWIREERD